jgi:hypothetical protein
MTFLQDEIGLHFGICWRYGGGIGGRDQDGQTQELRLIKNDAGLIVIE